MPANPVPINIKQKGLLWLQPPYNWSHRQIAKKLDVSPSVVSRWRNELIDLFGNYHLSNFHVINCSNQIKS
nr:helix-turn-helix domain-containing protein [Candidatus Regiella insecticola]